MEILQKHVAELPESISRRMRRPCSAQLEMLILRCLAKNPDERPQTALEIADELGKCATQGGWNRRAAREWWQQFFPHNADGVLKPETQDQRLASTAVISDVKLDTSERSA
jgi:hypothetical protein